MQALYPVHAGGRELLVPDTHLARITGHDVGRWADEQLSFVRELSSELAEIPGLDGELDPLDHERR